MGSKEDEATEMSRLDEEKAPNSAATEVGVENAHKSDITLRQATPQIYASLAALSIWLSIGVSGGFTAVLLPQLHDPSSDIPITMSQASWIAGLLPLSTGLGAVMAAYLVDVLGRRETTKLQTMPFVISWVITMFAGNVEALYVARILIGIAAGMGSTSNMYVTELAHPSLRGALCNMGLLMASIGTVLAYLLGATMRWRYAAAVCGIFPLLTLIVLCFVPESPRWLYAMGKKGKAEKAVCWFYSKHPSLAIAHWHALTLEMMSINSTKPTLLHRLRRFLEPGVLKPLGVLFGFFLFQQLSGVYVLLFYTVDLLRFSKSSIDPYLATVLVGLVRLITSAGTVVASRRIGRRPMAIASGLGMAVVMCVAGFALRDPALDWLPVTCILLFTFFSTFGFLCLPWSMSSELLPLHARGIGSGLCNTENHLLMFIVLKFYPLLATQLQDSGTLWFFSAASISGAIYVFFFLPETQGKTLPEIEAHFTNSRKTTKNQSS